MPEAGRLGDQSHVEADNHGCPACPHAATGSAIGGSSDVFINNKAALRVGDPGIHAACCGPNTWKAAEGAPAVVINGQLAHRKGDAVSHCGGTGKLIEGSANVIIGNDAGWHAEVPFGGGNIALALPDSVAISVLSPENIATSISNFRHGFRAGLASLAGELAEMSLSLGVGKLIGLLDKVVPGLGSRIKLAFWAARKHIPGLNKLLYSLRAYVKMFATFLLHIFDLDSNDCPMPQDAPLPGPDEELIFSQEGESLWKRISSNQEKIEECEEPVQTGGPTQDDKIPPDVSRIAHRLLRVYRPVFVELAGDIDSLNMEDLLRHAYLDPTPGDSLNGAASNLGAYADMLHKYDPCPRATQKGNLVIDNELARGLKQAGGQRTYYGKAIKVSNNEIRLEYFALRPGSFFSNSYLDPNLFEHQGDGEGVELVVRRADEDQPWRLAGADFSGEHYTQCCTAPNIPGREQLHQVPLEMVGSRPVIYVAIGSHALCPRSGKRRVMGKGGIKGFFQSLAIDFYPSRTEDLSLSDYALVTSAGEHVNKAVFTKRAAWGKSSEILGTSPYGGRNHHPIAPELNDVDADEDEYKFWCQKCHT